MTLVETKFYNDIKKQEDIALGTLYFFERFVVAEFNEGENIGFDNFSEAKAIIKSFYGNEPFGFIANRINSYSIVVTDAPKFNEAFQNLAAYATVTYSSFAQKIFEVENHFFKFNRRNFDSVIDAVTWVDRTLIDLKVKY